MAKIAFITGATAGFGKACAEKFASHGYDLILNGRREDRLEELLKDLEGRYNIAILLLPFDVSNKKSVFESIEKLPDEWRKIHVLINNAGLALGRDFIDEGNLDDWDTMIDTNVKGLLYVSRALLPIMIQNKETIPAPLIINMGSVAGKEVYEKGNVYCASKYAVDAISKSMRVDLLRHGIKVTAIHPGAAETEFSLVRFKGDQKTADSIYNGLTPLIAEDIADAAFYCSSLPAHVCINELVITCTQQANAIYFNRNQD